MNKRLPVVTGSTAATTAFCAEKIEGPGGLHLWIDGNAKITASQGSLADPKPNAFSILQVDDCPYRTPTCEAGCYVHGLEKHAKTTHDLYRENSDTIRQILGRWFSRWSAHLAEWISDNCNEFRWHVSGDVFSDGYAEFIAEVCLASPDVRHWIYTRSFPDREILRNLLHVSIRRGGNLEINLSADQDNYWLARRVADEHGLRVCYMTVDGTVPKDLRPGDVIFPDYSLRGLKEKVVGMVMDGKKPADEFDDPYIRRKLTPSEQREASSWWQSLTAAQQHMVCPVDFYGKSERNRCGPCRKCMGPTS